MKSTKSPKNYFKVQIVCFKMMGLAMEESSELLNGKAYILYSFVLLNACVYMFFITEAMDLIINWGDVDNTTFNLCYLIVHLTGLFKIAIMKRQQVKIIRFYRTLESGCFLPDNDRGGAEEFRIISEAIWQSNLQTYIFYTLVTVIVAIRGFYAGFDKGYYIANGNPSENGTMGQHYQLLPYTTWIPFDTNTSPYYEIAFAYQIIGALIYGLLIGTCDSLIAGFMVHIKAQLLILKNSLGSCIDRAKLRAQGTIIFVKDDEYNMKRRNVENTEKLTPEIQIYVRRYLRECIIHHQEIINMTEIVESEFSYLMLVQFLGSIMLLCLSLFQLSIDDMRSTRFVSMVFFTCLMLFQLLIFCWNGNEVLAESLEIAFAAYDSDWFLCDTTTQKELVLIIHRAQRALKISAGKFAYLTLETYMNILRASASYYMVLRKVNE